MMHARVPYDTASGTRLMWRLDFQRDPLDARNYLEQHHAKL